MPRLSSIICTIYGHRLDIATVVREQWKSAEKMSVLFFDHGISEFVEVSFRSREGEARVTGQILSVANRTTISHYAACRRCGKVNWQS